MRLILKLVLSIFVLASTPHSIAQDNLCVDSTLPDVLEKLLDTALKVGASGELLNLAVLKTTKEMAHVGNKVAPYDEFVQRAIFLSDNRIEDGKHILREGIGGARIETMEGIKLRRASSQSELGIDFFNANTDEKISLKGPLLQDNMDPIPIPSAERPKAVARFAESIFKINTVAKTVYVDLMGLSAREVSEVKQYVVKNMASKGLGRTFRFVE